MSYLILVQRELYECCRRDGSFGTNEFKSFLESIIRDFFYHSILKIVL